MKKNQVSAVLFFRCAHCCHRMLAVEGMNVKGNVSVEGWDTTEGQILVNVLRIILLLFRVVCDITCSPERAECV